jgi:hypothetical protein
MRLLFTLQPSSFLLEDDGEVVVEDRKDELFPPTKSNPMQGNGRPTADSRVSMSESPSAAAAATVNIVANTDKTFGDSDEDELFSQIDEELIGDTTITSTRQSEDFDREEGVSVASSPITRQSLSPQRGMASSGSSSTLAPTNYSSQYNVSNNVNSSLPMGPPAAPVPSHSQRSSISTSTLDNPSARGGISLTNPNSNQQIISQTDSPSSTCPSSMDTSREAFFANWDNDDVSSYEKRLKTLKRRFPGPAGLLPIIPLEEVKHLSDADHPLSQHISKIISSDLLLQKQQNESSPAAAGLISPEREIHRINKRPWRELIRVLKLNPKDPIGLLSLMNIRWVKRTVCRHPVTTKIPFLALVVQEEPELLGLSSNKRTIRGSSAKEASKKRKNPSIKLMDPTGSIVAAMDAKFVEKFGHELAPGTAIAVKNVSSSCYC